VQSKVNEANRKLLAWLRAGLKREGLDRYIGVSDGQVTADQIPNLKALGTLRQR
jgi:hypothetical protein